jgi:ABC-type branched-subunit amino acid transport system substrate-binding protein
LSRRTLRRLVAASLALAAVISIAACTGGDQQAGGRHKLDLKIGDLVPLSGVEQPFGAPGQKAADLAIKQIRAAIDKAKTDHTVSITHQNYRSDQKLAQDLAARLVRGGRTCLIGPWSSGAANPVASQVSIRKKVVEISPAATSDALEALQIGGYFNRVSPADRLQGEALATAIADELGGAEKKKVSIGALKNIYGTDLVDSFSAAWKKLGGKVAARVIYEQNLPDYKKQARELVTPNPDAFVFFDFQENYTKVATELVKTKKWKASKSFATDSLAVSTLGQTGGATVEGLRGIAPSWPRSGPIAKAFNRLYAAGPPPAYRQPGDAQAFDAVVLCYLSAVAAGSTKGSQMRHWVRRVSSPPGTKYSFQQLPEAIKALEAGQEIDYDGASGPIDIEPTDIEKKGNPTAGFYDAYRFTNARLTLYGSVSVPASEAGIERFPPKFVTPRIPGQPVPTPKGATGASGASGATGAKGAKPKKSPSKKKGK